MAVRGRPRARSVVTPDVVTDAGTHPRSSKQASDGAGKELAMSATVVYESVYGNTRAVAEAIAEGLGDARVLPVHEAPDQVEGQELLVIGGPTHMHGMATSRSRQAAVEALHEDGNAHLIEPGATEEPGLRGWLRDLPEGLDIKAA